MCNERCARGSARGLVCAAGMHAARGASRADLALRSAFSPWSVRRGARHGACATPGGRRPAAFGMLAARRARASRRGPRMRLSRARTGRQRESGARACGVAENRKKTPRGCLRCRAARLGARTPSPTHGRPRAVAHTPPRVHRRAYSEPSRAASPPSHRVSPACPPNHRVSPARRAVACAGATCALRVFGALRRHSSHRARPELARSA